MSKRNLSLDSDSWCKEDLVRHTKTGEKQEISMGPGTFAADGGGSWMWMGRCIEIPIYCALPGTQQYIMPDRPGSINNRLRTERYDAIGPDADSIHPTP